MDIGGGFKGFYHSKLLKKPMFASVWCLEGVQACTFQWRSHLWQARHLPDGQRRSPMLLPVVELGPAPLLEIATSKAWWSMTRTQVARFAKLAGIQVDESASLLDMVVSACKTVLGADDEGALDVAAQRLAVNDIKAQWSAEIMQIDEASAVLERSDADLVAEEQRQAQSTEKDDAMFLQEFRQRRFDVRALAKAGSRAKAKAKAAPRQRMPSSIPHAEAKGFAPPGASVWRGLTRGQWCGHLPPRRRVSASWFRSGGERQALDEVLKRLWLQFLDLRGLSKEDCPWIGLLDE